MGTLPPTCTLFSDQSQSLNSLTVNMRSAILSIAIFAVGAMAQSVADLPTCSLPCFATTPSSNGCQLTDVPCLCADTAFQTAVAACIQVSCTDAADLQGAATVGAALCQGQGGIDTSSIAEAASSSVAESSSSVSSVVSSAAEEISSSSMMMSSTAMMSSMMPSSSGTAVPAGASSTPPASGANVNTVSKIMGAV